MSTDYNYELGVMRDDMRRLHGAVIQMATAVTSIRDHIEQLYREPAHPIECEHHVPLGDLCTECVREPKRTHCEVHDTNVIGACPYCAESHRLDTPEG